jgi:hypothetical protein
MGKLRSGLNLGSIDLADPLDYVPPFAPPAGAFRTVGISNGHCCSSEE